MQERTELKQTYPLSRRLEGFITVCFDSLTHKIKQKTKNISLVNMMKRSRALSTHTLDRPSKPSVPDK